MVENTKIYCIHCRNHIGNQHIDPSIIVVPLSGKSEVLRVRLNKVYDGIAGTCIGSYVNEMCVQFKCFSCNRNTTHECRYDDEVDFEDWGDDR